MELSGNTKRIEACKQVGGMKKRAGHERERDFNALFGARDAAITYKAEADCIISPDNAIMRELDRTFGPLPNTNVSVKGGNNLQFTLGRIDEITNATNKLSVFNQRDLWETYLAKSKSGSPASILAYRTPTSWLFFSMRDVVDFIVASSSWREVGPSRIKGDFKDDSKKGTRQYLTFEYRTKHKSYFLGANGNRGEPFMCLLKKNLRNYEFVVGK